MEKAKSGGALLARCIVCRSDIYAGEEHEVWEGGFYCRRHSLPVLRERAREYAELLRQEAAAEP
jgi:hypothetical protein